MILVGFEDKSLTDKEEIGWEQWARKLSEEKYENDVAAAEAEFKERLEKEKKEAVKEAMKRIALCMIYEGKLTDEKIGEVTNLSVSEVKKIRANN